MESNRSLPKEAKVDIHKLKDDSYRKNVVNALNQTEHKQLIQFLNMYPPFLVNFNNLKEQKQLLSSLEKITVNKFRQHGLMFKLQEHDQGYLVPFDIAEDLVLVEIEELSQKNKTNTAKDKTYLYLIFLMIQFVHEKSLTSMQALEELMYEKTSYHLEIISSLCSFLVEEEIVKVEHKKLTICDNKYYEVFIESSIPIELRLIYFISFTKSKAPYPSLYLAFLLTKYSEKKYCLCEVTVYLIENQSLTKTTISDILKLLELVDLVRIEDGTIQGIDHQSLETFNGIQISPFEIMVPVFTNNKDLWMLLSWGDVSQWESMIHITFSVESFTRALKYGRTLEQLIHCLGKYFPEDTIFQWKAIFNEWVKMATPIQKKSNITFYPLTDNLRKESIKNKWTLWAMWVEEGVLIDSMNEPQFEKKLKEIGIPVSEEKFRSKRNIKNKGIKINREIPSLNEAFPELNFIPKQWFHLTSYEERTRLRIIKQAIVLQLCVQLEVDQKMEVLQPTKVEVENGNYTVVTNDCSIVPLEKVKRIAIIHPIDSEEAK